MMAAAFFLFIGAVLGSAMMILVGLYLTTRPKTKQAKYHDGLPATSISLTGKPDTRIDAHSARQLADVLKNYEGTRQ
jgi:hypothetical protein